MAALLIMGVYRGLWRYISLDNVVVYAKGVVLGSVASVLVLLFVCRFAGYSRAVFALDAFILLSLLTGSRLAFRLFRRLVPLPATKAGRRVLIYGAGDAGDLLLRELRNNRLLDYSPVGFLDDDPLKKGTVINGLRVLGGNGAVIAICRQFRVAEVVISTAKIADDRLRVILHDCEQACVTVKRMQIRIEALTAAPAS
jgi:UDP-GlcNAc:undecaprenyl-phosphate GlcNAc-1-phosphate transferase